MADGPNPPTAKDRDEPTPGAQKPATPRWVKIFGAAALLLAVVALLAVFSGGEHGPGRHSGGQRTPTSVGGPADEADATRTVEVSTLDAFAFQPATMTVSAGETVTFAVTNPGASVHEFTLGDADMQQEHARAMAHAPAGMAHEFPNAITIPPGETKRLTWRFGGAGTLEYACHVAGHHEAGMRGMITVA